MQGGQQAVGALGGGGEGALGGGGERGKRGGAGAVLAARALRRGRRGRHGAGGRHDARDGRVGPEGAALELRLAPERAEFMQREGVPVRGDAHCEARRVRRKRVWSGGSGRQRAARWQWRANGREACGRRGCCVTRDRRGAPRLASDGAWERRWRRCSTGGDCLAWQAAFDGRMGARMRGGREGQEHCRASQCRGLPANFFPVDVPRDQVRQWAGGGGAPLSDRTLAGASTRRRSAEWTSRQRASRIYVGEQYVTWAVENIM